MKFAQFLEMKFLEWQQASGGRKTVKEFAEYIGVSQSAISMWWNGDRKPEGETLRKLSLILGIEIYDSLGLPRPNQYLQKINRIFESIPEDEQRRISEEVEKYETKRKK